jgi:hypothetical protein
MAYMYTHSHTLAHTHTHTHTCVHACLQLLYCLIHAALGFRVWGEGNRPADTARLCAAHVAAAGPESRLESRGASRLESIDASSVPLGFVLHMSRWT